jgi:hypothetical protein
MLISVLGIPFSNKSMVSVELHTIGFDKTMKKHLGHILPEFKIGTSADRTPQYQFTVDSSKIQGLDNSDRTLCYLAQNTGFTSYSTNNGKTTFSLAYPYKSNGSTYEVKEFSALIDRIEKALPQIDKTLQYIAAPEKFSKKLRISAPDNSGVSLEEARLLAELLTAKSEQTHESRLDSKKDEPKSTGIQ